MNDYTIPKPTPPAAAYILGCMVIIGLIGLGVAAYAAFEYIGRPVQAAAFALIVEAGMISEALAIVRKNKLAIPGLIVSLGVSGMYNYTQAERAGLQLTPALTDPVQLAALSIGPLSAVFFLALALGRELATHEAAITQWAADRQKWQDDQAERAAKREERREARAARVEAAKNRVEAGADLLRTSTPQDRTSIELPRGTYEDFQEVLQANHHEYKNADLAERFHVSTRTITDWRKRYQETHPQPIPQEN